MNAARPPKSRRPSGRGRTGRTGRGPGRPGPAPRRSGAPDVRRPVPFERGRAAAILGGLLAFTAGFAVAGVLVLADLGGSPPYMIMITIGLIGIGATGFAISRGVTPMPQTPIWSPPTLRLLAAAADLPALPTLAVLYVLGAAGVLGNLVFPLVIGG